ncbi:MAG TPA: NAD-dependent epimerase/dehydratase family protein [Amycolatopsis sp.]|uniref:NAD-dependent epimerase/dehydratase family protein n=1 Tax=Amycolatopsis sp. TaxID=37632 RepID=UPI002B458F6C|nr:NAD-dependent epimerase/dehydratase family protein [Amycolatopsis sp.]HKS44931.1 NAD-dependent epimerase/dehydratase family protein [Amycolatopsis sp.]
MRAVVTGASGNVGTSVIEALSPAGEVDEIVGVARREPEWTQPKLRWTVADVGEDDLAPLFRGADVVIHLAWLFQPTHHPTVTWRNNVLGSIRVFEAVATERVPALIYASSVGAYSPGPKDSRVDENWPTHGWPTAAYPREKAYLERCLDSFERDNSGVRVVRLRPGFVFKREAASQQRRLFAGPLLPGALVRPSLLPVVPDVPGLQIQAVHSADVGEAYRLAALGDFRGAFNVAAEPVVDASVLAEMFGARKLSLPPWAVRASLAAAWRAHLVPASPGLFETVLRLPLMDTTRARTELGWTPRHSATDAIEEFLSGLRGGAGTRTPPLRPDGLSGRVRELRTHIGGKP